jgi:hypothetical protein
VEVNAMRTVTALLPLLALAATGGWAAVTPTSTNPPPQVAGAEKAALWVAVSVSEPVREAEVKPSGPFMVHFGVVNDGDQPIDAESELRSSQLLVNGQEFKDWPFIIAGGPRDARWKSLPPGDYLRFGCNMQDYFQQPGVYRVSLKGKGFQSAEVVFRVLPRK